MFGSSAAYRGLNSSEVTLKNESIISAQTNRPSLRKILVLIIFAIVVTFLTVSAAVETALLRQAQHKPANVTASSSTLPSGSEQQRYTTCGHSPAEARARGCSFDISSFAWLTPECYDDALTQEFKKWSNWTWYRNEEPSDDDPQISFEEAMAWETDAWADWGMHLVHCTFMWRLQHLSMEKGWTGIHVVNYNHTKHCQQVLLMDPVENRDIRTSAAVVYPRCIKVGMEEGMYPAIRKRET
ncbi:hypothetical protein BJ878DRAFT_509788 [Calycina marina]|uniref:Uncharacterized protein n=1 Tax=Calycina marina TaxID=1763456 RepID=A0A9P8CFS5_9HELO|nr:hypothetical protein BJ878DRAFT_509788 [Calycina marina]